MVEGYFVGLDATGTNSLASPGFGVFVQTPDNRSAAPHPARATSFPARAPPASKSSKHSPVNNVVQGNFIGTDRTGTIRPSATPTAPWSAT